MNSIDFLNSLERLTLNFITNNHQNLSKQAREKIQRKLKKQNISIFFSYIYEQHLQTKSIIEIKNKLGQRKPNYDLHNLQTKVSIYSFK